MELTEQEINKGNELIAEFMGLRKENGFMTSDSGIQVSCSGYIYDNEFVPCSELQWYPDWNWLMSVVLKINTMDDFQYSVTIYTMDCIIKNQKDELISICECENNPNKLINSVWKAIVEFIIWYNKQK